MMNNKTAYKYLDEHLISPSLTCPICLEILDEPYTHTPCDSAFCRSCLLQLAEPCCPICRWTWDATIPLQYNIFLPRSSRLIRNMLDDLLVKCTYCGAVRRRGDFQHNCQKNDDSSIEKLICYIPKSKFEYYRRLLCLTMIGFLILLTFTYKNMIIEQAVNRQHELIHNIGINIDNCVLQVLYYLTVKSVEYSIMMFFINICFWFCLKYCGNIYLTRTINEKLKYILEMSTIMYLIIYSLHH